MKKLKPCPFCGGKAKTWQDMYGYYLVQCNKCGIGTLHNNKYKKEAVKKWNKRTNTTGN